jgi:hypothetical protein
VLEPYVHHSKNASAAKPCKTAPFLRALAPNANLEKIGLPEKAQVLRRGQTAAQGSKRRPALQHSGNTEVLVELRPVNAHRHQLETPARRRTAVKATETGRISQTSQPLDARYTVPARRRNRPLRPE